MREHEACIPVASATAPCQRGAVGSTVAGWRRRGAHALATVRVCERPRAGATRAIPLPRAASRSPGARPGVRRLRTQARAERLRCTGGCVAESLRQSQRRGTPRSWVRTAAVASRVHRRRLLRVAATGLGGHRAAGGRRKVGSLGTLLTRRRAKAAPPGRGGAAGSYRYRCCAQPYALAERVARSFPAPQSCIAARHLVALAGCGARVRISDHG